MSYFKATRPNGADFYTGKIDYAKALKTGEPIRHPNPFNRGAAGYISVAIVATDCTSFSWPARLFEVELTGTDFTPEPVDLPNKRAGHEVQVIKELPAWQLFGPRGEAIVAILDRFPKLGLRQREKLRAALNSQIFSQSYSKAWSVVYDGRADRAGLVAARYALIGRLYVGWYGGGYAACGAALAVLFADLIDPEDYEVLTKPWRTAIGPVQASDDLPARGKK